MGHQKSNEATAFDCNLCYSLERERDSNADHVLSIVDTLFGGSSCLFQSVESSLKLCRRKIAQFGVAPLPVVKDFDVLDDISCCFVPAPIIR